MASAPRLTIMINIGIILMYFGSYSVTITDLITDKISTAQKETYFPGLCIVRY